MKIIHLIISFIDQFRNWLGRPFWTFQVVVFLGIVAGGFWTFVRHLSTGNTLEEEVINLGRILTWWIAFAVPTTLLWSLFREIFNLDLWFYYRIWIRKLAPLIMRDRIKKQRALDIRASFEQQRPGDRRQFPTFVRREHLMRKRYWPNWVFSTIAILDPHKVRQVTEKEDTGTGQQRWTLNLNLQNESFGIYNNAGKRFLARRFSKVATSEQLLRQSNEFHNFMLPTTQAGKSLTWGEIGESSPLRWASGGFLPIVQYCGKSWAALFFRDIRPIGLNVANGASENKKEYKDLNHLIGREFAEETILISSRPRPGSSLSRKIFATFGIGSGGLTPILNSEFAEKHDELRFKHDRIQLTPATDHKREIKPIFTPFSVRVRYHLANMRNFDTRNIYNVVYSLNPAEFGIEVIWLCTFKMEDGEYLIDGEYHLSREILIRRPVILLDMEFLQRVYTETGALGEFLREEDRFECRLLPPVPEQHCVVFDADVELRKRRLRTISQALADPELAQKLRSVLKWEQNLIESWLDHYQDAFANIPGQGLQEPRLRTLCPVTWKTLELVFAHQLDYSS